MNSPTMTGIARFPQVRISLRESRMLETERPGERYQRFTGPNRNHLVGGDCMAPKAHNARSDSAQPITDPLIAQARLINEAADLEHRLAIRKALRPVRSQAARKGWEARRG